MVTNRPLNTTLPNSNSHDKYIENIHVGGKEPINAETYSRLSNDKNDSFCLFVAYFIHVVMDNNHIFKNLSPIHVGILLYDVFGGGGSMVRHDTV